MTILRIGFVLSLLVLLTSCAQFKLIHPNSTDIRGFTVTPENAWSQSEELVGDKCEVWTVDGFDLNEMIVFGEIAQGESIFYEEYDELPMPQFRSDMLPNDLEDLIKTSIANIEYGSLEVVTKNVRPQLLGETAALRFELHYYNEDGLKKTGDIIVWIKNQKLYGMMFFAPSLHYFESYKEDIERTFKSIKV